MNKIEEIKRKDKWIIALRDVFFRLHYVKKDIFLYFQDLDISGIDLSIEMIRERIKKEEKKLKKLTKGTIYKIKNREMLFCKHCGKITKHNPHSYEDRPLGFGGWISNYNGLICSKSKCGNIIYQHMVVELGLS